VCFGIGRLPVIKRIEITNFKSLHRVAIDLSPVSVFLGPNAAGKSNIIRALQFFRELVLSRDIETALEKQGGAREIRTKTVKKTPNVRLSIEMDLAEPRQFHERSTLLKWAKYTIDFTCYVDRSQRVNQEELLTKTGTERHQSMIFRREADRVQLGRWPPDLFGEKGKTAHLPLPKGLQSTPFLSMVFPHFEPATLGVYEYVKRMRFYDIDARKARRSSDSESLRELNEDCSNLSAILLQLRKTKSASGGDRGLVAGFTDFMRTSVPEFEDFHAKKLGRGGKAQVTFSVKETSGAWFSPHSLSDGTIRLMCFFLALMYRRSPAPIICFEEPENCVHPYLISRMMDLVKIQPHGSQILITTHSKAIADAFGPENVFLVSKKEGDTLIKRADEDKEVRQFCQHYGMGEAWIRGLIGAVP